jgi:hypothetical protein
MPKSLLPQPEPELAFQTSRRTDSSWCDSTRCSARASAAERAVAAQGGLASLCRLVGSSPRIDAGGRYLQLVSVGVGKRRWYATIFSFDRPRSRSISTELDPSRAGFTPRSLSPWPKSLQSLVFTRAPCSSRPFPPRSTSVLCRLGPHSPLWATSASETRIRLLLFNRLSRHVAWRQQFGSSNRSGGPRSCHNRRLQPKTALSGSSPGRRTKPDGRLRVDSGPARCARRRRSSAAMPAPLGRAQAPRSLRPYTEARAATASSIVAA